MSARAVKFLGTCDRCGEDAPEMRDSLEEAEQDARECESDACMARPDDED